MEIASQTECTWIAISLKMHRKAKQLDIIFIGYPARAMGVIPMQCLEHE